MASGYVTRTISPNSLEGRRVQRDIYAESNGSALSMLAYLALRATTKSGRFEAGCCATVMRRAAPWPETSFFALCATKDMPSRHVRRVASRLSSPPLAPGTKTAYAVHEMPSLREGYTKYQRKFCYNPRHESANDISRRVLRHSWRNL